MPMRRMNIGEKEKKLSGFVCFLLYWGNMREKFGGAPVHFKLYHIGREVLQAE